MLKREQHAFVLHRVNPDNTVFSSILWQEIKISEDSIRRDLRQLSEGGKVIKVQGGASSLSSRQLIHTPEIVYSLQQKGFTHKRRNDMLTTELSPDYSLLNPIMKRI